MGRPTLLNHLKFRRLERELKSRALALGTLELIWHHAYEHGDFIASNEDLELICDWQGEPGFIGPALVYIGFLDPHPDGEPGYFVHDLYDHAPQYVQRRAEREHERRVKGQSISSIRRQAASQRKQMASHLQPDASHGYPVTANSSPPAPAPAPTPREEDLSPAAPLPRPKKARRKVSDFGEGVMAVVDRAGELWPEVQPGSVRSGRPEGEPTPAMSPILFAHRINLAMSCGYTPAEIIRGMELYVEEMVRTKHYLKAPQFWLGEPPKAPGWAYLDAARALAGKEGS